MTLDEWIGLTQDERNRLRRLWKPKGEDWQEWQALVAEAAKRFSEEYGHFEQIKNVFPRISLLPDGAEIMVVTYLERAQIIENLPDRYLTFRVIQEPIYAAREYTLEIWTRVLFEFLGWSKEQVIEWARRKWWDDMNDAYSLFYHETSCYWIAPLLVPADLQGSIGRHHQLMRFTWEIQNAIEGDPSRERCSSADYDWIAAKERVRKLCDEWRLAIMKGTFPEDPWHGGRSALPTPISE